MKNPELKATYPDKWRNSTSQAAPQTHEAWWLSLNDPVLNDTISLAQKQNLSISQASERLIAARNIGKSIIAAQYPQVGFTAGPDNLSRGTTNASTAPNFRTKGAYLAGFDLNWELPFFGRGVAQRKIAQAGVDQATADLQAIKVSIAAEVVRTYGNLRAAQEKTKLLKQQLMHFQSLEKLHAGAADAGFISRYDYGNYRSTLAEAKHALLTAQTQQEIALQRMMVLCGLTTPLDAWAEQSDATWNLPHDKAITPDLPAEMIRQRPDIYQAEAVVMNAAGQAGIAHADIYPKFSIEGALQIAGSVTQYVSTRSIVVLAPAVSIPIIDWGLARSVANARDAKLREAILAYREAVLLAIEETETALTNFNAAQEHLGITEAETEFWSAESVRGESAFNSGYISRPDMLKIGMKMTEHNLQQIDTKLEWITAFALANKAQARMRDDFYAQ